MNKHLSQALALSVTTLLLFSSAACSLPFQEKKVSAQDLSAQYSRQATNDGSLQSPHPAIFPTVVANYVNNRPKQRSRVPALGGAMPVLDCQRRKREYVDTVRNPVRWYINGRI